MNAADPPDIFTKRGIPEEIWQARPYVYWTKEDTEPAKRQFADLERGQRTVVSNILNQSSGYAITRYTPPMFPELPHIHPELRPDNPVKTRGPRTHWHGDGEPPEDLKWSQTMPGDRKNWRPHIDKKEKEDPVDDDAVERILLRNAHGGANTEALHRHQPFAKYVFPPGRLIDKEYEHDHATSWRSHAAVKRPVVRVAHVARKGKLGHDGVDVDGPHGHTERQKAGDDYLAARIDVHPLAVQRIIDSPVVFLGIEGCLKADAMLADAILTGGGYGVCSSPSVTLWDCDELQRFAAEYLSDKTVVIVPDADWNTKALVINQATLRQNVLIRMAVPNVLVAAPPATYRGKPTNGVDDFIGAGGHLEDLLVIDSESAKGLWEWIASKSLRIDQALRDYEWLRDLSRFTRATGVLEVSLQSVARALGKDEQNHRRRAYRAVKSLEKLGALTIDVCLDIEQDYFNSRWDRATQTRVGGWGWKGKPIITLIEELRSTERPTGQRLCEAIHLPLRAPERGAA